MISLIPTQSKGAASPPPKNQAAPSGMPLHSFWLELFITITVMVLLGIAPLVILDAQQAQTVANRVLNTQVDALAQRLSQVLNLYHAILQGAATDATLGQLVARGDSGAVAAREQALTNLIPGALRIRLLKPEYDIPDLKSEPPLSYASLELLKLAESAAVPPPLELVQVNKTKLYVVGAAALRDAPGQVQGLFHLTLSAAILRDEVEHFGATQGQVALQQQVNDHPVTIFGIANSATPAGLRQLAGSQLQLAYWYGSAEKWPLFIPSLWVIAALIIACGMTIVFQYWRLRVALAADKAILLSVLENAVAGNKYTPAPLSIREFTDTLEAIVKLAKEIRFKVSRPSNGSVFAAEIPPQGTQMWGTELQEQQTSSLPTSKASELPPGVVAKELKREMADKVAVAPAVTGAGRQLASSAPAAISLPETIFRAYDIRGVVGQSLTTAIARELGRAIGSLLQDKGQQTISVAWDARPSGMELSTALIAGLMASGRDVVELGVLPTPMLYFATRFLDSDAGVMVSAGRFPNDYNGFKVLIDGELLTELELQALRQRTQEGPLWEGAGSKRSQDLIPAYIERIADDISIARPLKVVIDCGNGCSALVAPLLFQSLGCEVVELFCELDNSFPGHTPDPSRPENLKLLQAAVLSERADIGLAFDGDGDRLGVVDSRGRIIWPDRLLMALAADVLARNPGGDVIFDVNCSRALASQILQNGGRPVMWKTGHAAIKAKLRDAQALLAGEWGGHIVFQERWYGFDDACYAGARLLEILAVDPRSSAELFDDCPESLSTPEYSLWLQEGEQQTLIKKLQEHGELLSGARLIIVDGLRAEYEYGWGLVRAANTVAALRFRFEADNEAALGRIQQAYRDLLAAVAPKLKAPF